MTHNTNLVPVNLDQLPSTQIGSDDQFAELAKSADYLGRLQLFTKGKAVNRKLVGPGNYGIPESDEEVNDLGDTIDIIPLARRPKAIDMTDTEAIIVNYDPDSGRVQADRRAVAGEGMHCMYGPSFLVFERSTGRFLEFFCGNKSSRSEAKKVYPYLPLTQADIDARGGRRQRREHLEPHGPLPLTLKSRLVEKGTYSWHVPVVIEVRHGLHEAAVDGAGREGDHAFLTVKDNGVERAAAAGTDRPRANTPVVTLPRDAGRPRIGDRPPVTCIMGGYLFPTGPAARPRWGYLTALPCGGNSRRRAGICWSHTMNPECLFDKHAADRFQRL